MRVQACLPTTEHLNVCMEIGSDAGHGGNVVQVTTSYADDHFFC